MRGYLDVLVLALEARTAHARLLLQTLQQLCRRAIFRTVIKEKRGWDKMKRG